MNKFVYIITAATCAALCAALLWPVSALAKMSGAEEQQYRETKQAAVALAKSKDFVKAREKFAEARELAAKGQDKKKEYGMLMRTGALCIDQPDFAAAEASFKEALTIAEANSEIGDGPLASCLYQLSDVLQKEKRDSDARPYLARCIEISKRIYSSNHPSLAVRTGEYASLISKLGDKEEGARLSSQSQAEVNSFMDSMSQKIKKAWQPTTESFSYRVEVSYQVLNHGKVDKVEVAQSSGSAIADKAAIDAVKAGAPFSDITCTDPDDELCLAFNFDYNCDKRPKSSVPGSRSVSHPPSHHQSKDVQEETQAKLTEEKAKSSKLKDQIDNLLQTSPDDATSLANLYVQFSRSLAIQGEHLKAINILKDALSKDCFKSTEDPPVISLRIGLADIYLKATGLGDAEGTLKQLIEGKNFDQVPRDLKQEALEDYGHCLSKSHKFAQAQDYYTRARELKE